MCWPRRPVQRERRLEPAVQVEFVQAIPVFLLIARLPRIQ
jgi:hypothetical protein